MTINFYFLSLGKTFTMGILNHQVKIHQFSRQRHQGKNLRVCMEDLLIQPFRIFQNLPNTPVRDRHIRKAIFSSNGLTPTGPDDTGTLVTIHSKESCLSARSQMIVIQ